MGMSEMTSEETAAAPAGQPSCRWEYESGQQCTRPPAPRRGARGPAPVYCEQADEPGQPVHNPLNAWRAKTRADAAGQDPDPQAERAPVATAIRTADGALDRAEQLAAALRDRKSVVEGKSVDLGGRRIIKKNTACARCRRGC